MSLDARHQLVVMELLRQAARAGGARAGGDPRSCRSPRASPTACMVMAQGTDRRRRQAPRGPDRRADRRGIRGRGRDGGSRRRLRLPIARRPLVAQAPDRRRSLSHSRLGNGSGSCSANCRPTVTTRSSRTRCATNATVADLDDIARMRQRAATCLANNSDTVMACCRARPTGRRFRQASRAWRRPPTKKSPSRCGSGDDGGGRSAKKRSSERTFSCGASR